MSSNPTQQAGDPLDILLVEDNHGDIRLTEEAFNASNPETVVNAIMNGDEAVDLLCEQTNRHPQSLPDIALVDLNLPGRDGCEVLKAIRSHPQLKPLPVIMLTSSAANDDIEHCYKATANAYLTKPTDPSEFESLAETIEDFWPKQAVLPPISA